MTVVCFVFLILFFAFFWVFIFKNLLIMLVSGMFSVCFILISKGSMLMDCMLFVILSLGLGMKMYLVVGGFCCILFVEFLFVFSGIYLVYVSSNY